MPGENAPVVIYHAACQDGGAAALAAYLKLGEEALYIPAQYGDAPPDEDVVRGRRLYVLDFCFERHDIERLMAVCDLQVLDHHRTHAEAFAGFDGPLHFDMTRSGATLAFEHFFPDQEVPELFRYVEDRDLWRFKLPHSKAITTSLRAQGGHIDFRRFAPSLAAWSDAYRERLATEGYALLKLQEQFIESMVARAERVVLDGIEALATNATVLYSEVAEALWTRLPPMGIAYFWDGTRGIYHVSLRSNDSFRVAEVALRHGGGGHDRAAAFHTRDLPWRRV